MSNVIVQIFSNATQTHGQPFVCCPYHFSEVVLEYEGTLDFDVHDVDGTTAECGRCHKERCIRRPLEALEYFQAHCSAPELLLDLAHALRYETLEDAFLQLTILRQKQAQREACEPTGGDTDG